MRLGEESDFFPFGAGVRGGSPFPCRKLSRRCSPSQQTLWGAGLFFHAAIYPQTPRAPREARSVTRGCNGTSLLVLGESPPGVALRSGGGHTGEGSALLPGHLCPWRTPGRSGTWKEGGCARRGFRACGVGSGELDGGCGEWRARRPSGGHRKLRDPHNSRRRPLPLRSVPGQSSLTPHPDVWRSGPTRRRQAGRSDAAPRHGTQPGRRLHKGGSRGSGPAAAPVPPGRPTAPRVAVGPPALPAARPRQPRQARPAPPAGAGSPC